MLIRCLDFETTGFPPNARVCEVGWTDVLIQSNGLPSVSATSVSRLCNPGVPIPAPATNVHGITDDMVAGAPPPATVFMDLVRGADVFCAHNAEFELNFFAGGERPWICTYKVALKAWPGLPNHRNGEIPRHLGIALDPGRCEPLHRAAPDTYVTAMILAALIDEAGPRLTPADLIRISTAPKAIHRMPFGMHKGRLIADLTDSQLRSEIRWITKAPDVRAALQAELERRTRK